MYDVARTIGPHLLAAKERLMAKGWPDPCVEVGNGDSVYWAYVLLDNADFPIFLPGNIFGATIEEILSEIDRAIDGAPTRTKKIADLAAALDALSPIERELLGVHWFDAQRAIERLALFLGPWHRRGPTRRLSARYQSTDAIPRFRCEDRTRVRSFRRHATRCATLLASSSSVSTPGRGPVWPRRHAGR